MEFLYPIPLPLGERTAVRGCLEGKPLKARGYITASGFPWQMIFEAAEERQIKI
jgi:hypothetical protein